MKKNYILTFLGIIFLLVVFIFVGYFVLHLSSRLIRVIVVAVMIACGISYLLGRLLCFKRINNLHQNGKYHECICVARKVMKWYTSGKNDSGMHLVIAISQFSLSNDEQFWNESEQVVDSRRIAEKCYWRTIFGVVINNQNLLTEQYQLFLAAVQNVQYAELKNRLDLLIGIMNANDETQKKDLVEKAKTIFTNKRIQDYLEQLKF
ncbi:MAG: hypothetical protein K2N74_01270 [Clostridiales bacterium]|nr:hypothetical protein [Clostridiales bacterium]